jgi:hypothetical protein
MTTIAIPADIVRELRGALYHQLGAIAEDIASARREPGELAEWAQPVGRFERTRALLDLIGWGVREPELATLDIDRHRAVIAEALSESDSRAVEAFAAATDLTLGGLPETRVAVPGDFRELLTECLLEALRDAAETIEQCGLYAESYPEPLSEFDAIRAALDATGWGAATEVDADAHRGALQRALSGRLATERHICATAIADIERGHTGAERGRVTAYTHCCRIEAFMHTAGLTIPEAGGRDA